MSSLGSLMGGGKAENNDSLKYVAPKEPKKGKSKTPVKSTNSTQEPVQQQQQQSQQTQSQGQVQNTSKVLASAAVRLYQLNPQTRGYDAVNGGNPLGCVIVGMNLSYQILVYDGQKVPHATAPITKSFKYNLRDLYVSFGDSNGNNFSALFDSTEFLNTFARQLMAVVCHVCCHSPDTPQDIVKGNLPPTTVDAEPNATPLVTGASAGCRFKAWEVSESESDNPAAVFTESPFLESSDITKIKVGGGEDPVGGMGEALVGLIKNDRVIVGIPTGTAYNNCSGDLSLRKRPGVWVVVEMEIVKVKTEKKEKKKEKKEDKITSQKPFADSSSTEPQSSSGGVDSRSRSNSLSQRMANLAKQSGAINLLSPTTPSGREELPSQTLISDDEFERRKREQQQDFDRKMDLQMREQEQELEKQKLEHERKQLELEKQRQELQQQQVALVDGQEARSYYVPSESTASYVRQQQQAVREVAPREDFSAHFTNLQQTILSLQTSVMGIHTKIDGLMTAKESSSSNDSGSTTAALLQQMQLMQQQQQMAMFNPNAMFGGQMTNMGAMGGPMGGMNNHMHGMNSHTGAHHMHGQGFPQAHGHNTGTLPRGTELVSAVKLLVDEFSRNEEELVAIRQGGGGIPQHGGSGISEEQTAKLKEKLETLMTRNEKLMDEKSELREKYATLSETSAEHESKVSRLVREVESLKRQKEEDMDELDSQKRSYMKRIAALNSEVETLTLEASSNRSSTKQTSEDKERLNELENQLNEVMSDKSKLKANLNELEGIMMSSNNEWKTRLDDLAKEKSDAISKLKTKSFEEAAEKEAAWEKEKLKLKVSLADKDKEISDLRSANNDKDSADKMKNLEEVENTLKLAVAEKERSQERIEELEKLVKEQEQRIGDLESKKSSDAPNPEELITEFVQDLFGRLHFAFVPPDNSSIDLDECILSPNAVLKKCKKVLKQGANEFTANSTNPDRSTFVKLSR